MEPTTPASSQSAGARDAVALERKRARRKWIITGAGLLAAGAIVVFSGGESQGGRPTLTFAGFSNDVVYFPRERSVIRAWFWFTNGAAPVSCGMMPLRSVSGDVLADDAMAPPGIYERMPDTNSFDDLVLPHQALLFGAEVREAKLPLRAVISVHERSSGLARTKETVHQWLYQYLRPGSTYFPDVQTYSVTNEFWGDVKPER